MEGYNPKMVEIARNYRQFTQQQLSSMLKNINQPNLSKYEQGFLEISSKKYQIIAQALNFPVSFFQQKDLLINLSSLDYKEQKKVPKKALVKLLTDIKIIIKGIECTLNEMKIESPRFSYDLSNGWTPETAARKFRETLNIPQGGIDSLIEYLDKSQIIVHYYDTNVTSFDAITSYTDNGIAVILLNKHLSYYERKQILSRELAHLCLHINCNAPKTGNSQSEADGFANEFLMPEQECVEDLRALTFNKLQDFVDRWKVSKSFIVNRARAINAINESTQKYMTVELVRRKEKESHQPNFEEQYLTNLAEKLEIIRKEGTGAWPKTDEEIAASANLSVQDFEKLFLSTYN